MNEDLPSDKMSDVPWPTSAERMRVPVTSMLPGSELAPTPAAGLLKNAVQGAHDTIDRYADRAAPAVQQLGESVSAAEATLRAKAEQLRETGDAWAESLRCTVRDNPLAALAGAVAVGMLVARIARINR